MNNGDNAYVLLHRSLSWYICSAKAVLVMMMYASFAADHVGEHAISELCVCMRLAQVLATFQNSALPLGVDMVCSSGFDRDDEFFATVGVCKRVKVFEYAKVLMPEVEVHCPVLEMVREKLMGLPFMFPVFRYEIFVCHSCMQCSALGACACFNASACV